MNSQKRLLICALLVGAAFPLPVRYHLHFGEALDFEGDPDDDDAVIEEMVWTVKAAIQTMVNEGLEARDSVFF